MRGQVTSSSHFNPASLQISRLVIDSGANRVGIRFLPYETYAQPMVLTSNVIAQEHRGAVVYGNQDIHGTVVVEISNGHATSCEGLCECRTALRTYILKALA